MTMRSARMGLGQVLIQQNYLELAPDFVDREAARDSMSKAEAIALKDRGNKAFAAKDYDSAIEIFTQAISLDPLNHVLYSNRSAARAAKKMWTAALEDAEQCTRLNAIWSKGHARRGAALHGLHRYDEAIMAYQDGLKLEESAALRKGLKEVQDAKEASAQEFGIAKLFTDPNLLGKLAANPRTRNYLTDQAFVQKLQMLQQNPRLAESALQDARMIDVLGVLMGVNMQGFKREPDDSPLFPTETSAEIKDPSSPGPSSSSKSKPETSTPAPVATDDVKMTEEDSEDARAKKDAEAAKKEGSELYKKRNFAEAAQLFEKAWDVWPQDITYLTNAGAAYFENGDYDKAIEMCEKAVDEGRSLRTDFKLIAKALGRIGSSYQRKNDLANAIKYFEKSLTEHRTPDILNKLRDAERTKADADRLAYIDPEKSAVAREEGNALFKAGDFAGAVKSYTESIKRDPKDPKAYNNRAAAYTKLVALPEALKDAEEAIKVDPGFVKGYIRKSLVLSAMRDYVKALEAIQEAEEHDTDHKHRAEIQQQELKCQEALFSQRATETQEETLQRAMRDPEVAGIMTDPVIQQILQQAQTNPGALQDHMKNPVVREKIMKLVNAGIIRTR